MHGKNTRHIQFSLCLRKKPTYFSSWRMVYKLFADGAAQVRSPVHTTRIWFANCPRAVCEPLGTLMYTRLKVRKNIIENRKVTSQIFILKTDSWKAKTNVSSMGCSRPLKLPEPILSIQNIHSQCCM